MLKFDLDHYNTAIVFEDKWIDSYNKCNGTITIDEGDFKDILETMFRYGIFYEKAGTLPNEFIFN